jgi:hypothetical protein
MGARKISVAMPTCGDYSGSKVDVPYAITLKLMGPQVAATLKFLKNGYTYPGATPSRHYLKS